MHNAVVKERKRFVSISDLGRPRVGGTLVEGVDYEYGVGRLNAGRPGMKDVSGGRTEGRRRG